MAAAGGKQRATMVSRRSPIFQWTIRPVFLVGLLRLIESSLRSGAVEAARARSCCTSSFVPTPRIAAALHEHAQSTQASEVSLVRSAPRALMYSRPPPPDDIPLPHPREIQYQRSPGADRNGGGPALFSLGLRLFLDTADVSAWDELLPTGMFHGVTCNPTLLERAGQACTIESLHLLAARAFGGMDDDHNRLFPSSASSEPLSPPGLAPYECCQEFMCQAWGGTVDELVYNGLALSSFDRNRIVVKVPVTLVGTQAARVLIHNGVRVCLTACYGSQQAIVAAGVGAEYLAPYCGRMDDAGLDGRAECRTMQSIVRGVQSGTRILVASIRDVDTLVDLAAAGMETFTIAPDVARSLFQLRLTDQAAADFEQAAQRNTLPRAVA